jgi:hypothetical protein
MLLRLELRHFQEVSEHVEPMAARQPAQACRCLGNEVCRFLGASFARKFLDP